jgi:hypothetical protein
MRSFAAKKLETTEAQSQKQADRSVRPNLVFNYCRNLLVTRDITTMALLWVTKRYCSAPMKNYPES